MSLLIAGLILFLGIHSIAIFAPALRAAAVERLGLLPWKGLYTLVAIAGFVLICIGYGQARIEAPIWLWQPPKALRHLALLLMLPAFVLLLAAYLPGRIRDRAKHPMLAATKLWALAHLLANGGLHDVLLFGGFLAWAVMDRISLKRRANVLPPPGAPAGRWNDAIAVVGGLLLYGVFVGWLHRALIGVSPMAG
ncbi:MAG: NnrU family protein [Stagnimonas sp.]|nr:NnrU family protein [Stagnimonas sp.]